MYHNLGNDQTTLIQKVRETRDPCFLFWLLGQIALLFRVEGLPAKQHMEVKDTLRWHELEVPAEQSITEVK